MESNILRAKELFYYYNGSVSMMSRDEMLNEYLSYNISREVEIQWVHDMFDEKYSQMNINSVDSLINMTAFQRTKTIVLLDKLTLIEKYIIENLSRCRNTKGVEILVDSTLEDLYKINKIDVRQEIAAFERLKKKVKIRKIELMIWNCMNPVFVIRSIYNWAKVNYITPISVRVKRRLEWGSRNSKRRKIMESKVSKAKELFWSHNGYQYQMGQDGSGYIFSQYHIPYKIEREWVEELFDEKLERLSFDDVNTINDLISFMQVHLTFYLHKLRLIEKLILKNKNNDTVRKEMIRLIDAILTTLSYINNRNVKKEISTFEKLKINISQNR